MEKKDTFDFWYAVNNTEIVMSPSRHLETFGSTILHYHLVSELMDSVDQVRVREGRMNASQPKIITPEAYSRTFLEGFGEEASRYMEWLREHEQDIHILQYGYQLRQEAFSEHIISDSVQNVVDRVKNSVEQSGDPLGAVVVGVDDPWDVCLVKLFWEVIRKSAYTNVQQMQKRRLFESDAGVPRGVRDDIDKDFLKAGRDPALVGALGKKLEQYGLFEEYQDRFFSLVRTSRKE